MSGTQSIPDGERGNRGEQVWRKLADRMREEYGQPQRPRRMMVVAVGPLVFDDLASDLVLRADDEDVHVGYRLEGGDANDDPQPGLSVGDHVIATRDASGEWLITGRF